MDYQSKRVSIASLNNRNSPISFKVIKANNKKILISGTMVVVLDEDNINFCSKNFTSEEKVKKFVDGNFSRFPISQLIEKPFKFKKKEPRYQDMRKVERIISAYKEKLFGPKFILDKDRKLPSQNNNIDNYNIDNNHNRINKEDRGEPIPICTKLNEVIYIPEQILRKRLSSILEKYNKKDYLLLVSANNLEEYINKYKERMS